uniref:Zn(2)-C6 fungal-type domain-containing protein n=1 Tax=Coccidioides posadasii RMSCC 3488 TaxID=454284 RepID=A0A0J6FL51_COCPO|nr:hypothetical protein CPAG_06468 [Coccidioides posadasii RMSCC 3488]
MRSRTGCLTCRARKLKCDEQKPQCSQCRKASRECRPSEGIVFRHQQNASMNKDDRGRLKGFYSYKNTFDENSVWLEIPKQVTFIDVTDPYADELEASLAGPESAPTNRPSNLWGNNGLQHLRSADTQTHGLEALSAAATGDTYTLQQPPATTGQISVSSTVHNNIPFAQTEAHHTLGSMPSPNQIRSSMTDPASPSISIASNNNINFLLNPSTSISPPIDPSLHAPSDRRESPFHQRVIGSQTRPVETDHEIAFLLRHFSESPGQWMDLFDLGSYFASHVPIKAVSNPLLKYAACAYAAKQLGRVKGAKGNVGGVCSRQASMEIWPDADRVDWYFHGAKYYEKAIQLLMEALQHDGQGLPISTAEGLGQWQAAELCSADEQSHPYKRRRRFSNSRMSSANSDEVLAATAILSVYEFLDATGPAWDRHLSGVKSLLDIAEVGMMPLEQCVSPGETPRPPLRKASFSKARRATFWNFARQDYLSAFINKCKCRLDTDDLTLWTEAGLLLNDMGYVQPSNTSVCYQEGEDVMMEDMISNALVWLSSKIVNYLATDDSNARRTETALMARWQQLRTEVDVWYRGLSDAFKPCARVYHPPSSLKANEEPYPFQEIWYSIPMCASAMQHYHMARILLLVNKPPEPTAFRGTVDGQENPHRSVEAEIRFHCLEICGISLSRPDASARINSVQPLFLSGIHLTDDRERMTVLRLLREIESDLGWATEYRAEQLLKQWGWNHNGAT